MSQIPSFVAGNEDLLILYLSEYQQQLTYVEIGCNDPCIQNSTWLLYNNNWTGANILTSNSNSGEFKSKRPKDKTVTIEKLQQELSNLGKFVSDLNPDLLCIHLQNLDEFEVQLEELSIDKLNTSRVLIYSKDEPHSIPAKLQQKLLASGLTQVFNNRWSFLFSREPQNDLRKLFVHQDQGSILPDLTSKIQPIVPHEKTYEAWKSRGYEFNPLISFIVQTHNKSEQVVDLITKLAPIQNTETIVIDDGSALHHTAKIAAALTKGNQMLLRTNDLYEVITYDRAITLARGQLVVLLQDDETFVDYQWVQNAVKYFSEIPDLAILGGCLPIQLLPFEPEGDGTTVGEYTVDGTIAHTPNLLKQRLGSDPKYPLSFQFAATINRAPMWIHRGRYLRTLKYIDQDYAPFQADDYELCLRCWLSGLKVGWSPARFINLGEEIGGMRIWNNNLTKEQSIKNVRKVYATYGDRLNEINHLVDQANQAYWKSKS